ncbi:hypothetical protein AB0E83_15145 [Streptomyces sp. NPDC035033]|uniref:hypothetical protein n=1 Tax=Streptomyces sp. NPDC035033 TaxID=3155368 RepID=UPI0033D02FA2
MARSDPRTAPARRHPRRVRWRRRPFGAGLALALGGAEILLVQRAGPAVLCGRGPASGTRCRS